MLILFSFFAHFSIVSQVILNGVAFGVLRLFNIVTCGNKLSQGYVDEEEEEEEEM